MFMFTGPFLTWFIRVTLVTVMTSSDTKLNYKSSANKMLYYF